jgi:hypothetical protein
LPLRLPLRWRGVVSPDVTAIISIFTSPTVSEVKSTVPPVPPPTPPPAAIASVLKIVLLATSTGIMVIGTGTLSVVVAVVVVVVVGMVLVAIGMSAVVSSVASRVMSTVSMVAVVVVVVVVIVELPFVLKKVRVSLDSWISHGMGDVNKLHSSSLCPPSKHLLQRPKFDWMLFASRIVSMASSSTGA